jgi:hypothetical protein
VPSWPVVGSLPKHVISDMLFYTSLNTIHVLPKVNIQGDTKKRELLKNPTEIVEIQKKNLLTEIEPLQLAF